MILVELDRVRRLKFDCNTLSDADAHFNHKLLHILRYDPVVFDTLRVLLWAGLKSEDPTLTLEKAGVLMDVWCQKGNTQNDLAEKVVEAINESEVFKAYAAAGGDLKNPEGSGSS
jgi:hypothetical protein